MSTSEYRSYFVARTLIYEHIGGVSKPDSETFAASDSLMLFVFNKYPEIMAEFEVAILKPSLLN